MANVVRPTQSPPAAWRPILPGDVTERAFRVIDEIALDLTRLSSSSKDLSTSPLERDPTLALGMSGVALFFAYLARARPQTPEYALRAVHMLEASVAEASSRQFRAGLYQGLTGVAWAVEHLRSRLSVSWSEDPLDEVDQALIEAFDQGGWRDGYDLVGGLVGVGVYALERLPGRGGIQCLEAVVQGLSELSVSDKSGGLTWRAEERSPSTLGDRFNSGYFDLGVAHGVPGVIAFLGLAYASGHAQAEIARLLDGAVRWLLARKNPMAAKACFGAAFGEDGQTTPSRLAWCYGDAGVAAALFLAAQCVGEHEWRRQALDVAHKAALRPSQSSGVVDACLCHGSAGLGHIFNRLYQATDEPVFLRAAISWMRETLWRQDRRGGIGGYRAWFSESGSRSGRWSAEPGFLTGSAGIGLSLLSCTTSTAADWDRLLLTSFPNEVSNIGK